MLNFICLCAGDQTEVFMLARPVIYLLSAATSTIGSHLNPRCQPCSCPGLKVRKMVLDDTVCI